MKVNTVDSSNGTGIVKLVSKDSGIVIQNNMDLSVWLGQCISAKWTYEASKKKCSTRKQCTEATDFQSTCNLNGIETAQYKLQ